MKIFVGNLSSNVTEEELRHVFEAFGHVEVASILKKGELQALGFVIMPDKAEAQAALTGLNGTELKGLVLELKPAPEFI